MFRLSMMLRKQRKAVITRNPTELVFDSSRREVDFWRNWRALAWHERGRFWIDNGRLRYDLRSLHGFLFCLGAACFAGVLVAILGAPLQGLAIATALMGWFYGVNLLVALIRVPALIRRTVGA